MLTSREGRRGPLLPLNAVGDWSELDNQTVTASRPRLAHGVTLLGQFRGSGLSDAGYLVRRADGTMLLLPRVPFCLAEEIDGEKDLLDLAEALSRRLGRRIHADGVVYLIEKKLTPIAAIDDSGPGRREPKAVLDLAGRAAVIPPAVVRSIAKKLEFFFRAPIVALLLLGWAVTLTWIFAGGGLGADPRQMLAQPKSLLMLISITLVSALLHELGHASASSYGGAEPGAIGVGIYVVWPVLYTETTESYRLSRLARVRTNLGGIYFNLILISVFGLAHIWSNHGIWAAAAMIQVVLIVYQFLPFVRLDGYYLMTDITGIPDLFAYMRPALRGLVPGRAAGSRVQDLKPVVRLVVVAWALSAALALAWFVVRFVLRVPELAPTVSTQVRSLWGETISALSAGQLSDGAASVLVLALVAIQVFGLLVLFGRVIRRSCGALMH